MNLKYGKSPQHFRFSDDLRCNQRTFRSQSHRYDPQPFTPRWISGYGLQNSRPNKKPVSVPFAKQERKTASLKMFPNRLSTLSNVKLDHRQHKRSKRPNTSSLVYRVWDSSQFVKYRSNKRQFKDRKECSGDISVLLSIYFC